MNLPKYSKGFTLIELLVSMSIIAIISGGIVPTFTSYVKNQNLKQAQEQLKSDLRTVQNRALTGALSNYTFDNGSLAQYWGVSFPSGSGSSMTVFISNSDSGGCPPDPSVQQSRINLSSNVLYYGDGGCMFFSIKNGDVSGSLDSPINLKLNPTDESLDVNFESSGLIWTPGN